MGGKGNAGSESVGRALSLKVIVNRKHVPVGEESRVAVLLQLKAAESRGEGRVPLNLSFVLDRSGSMEGSKLAFTKQAVEFALHHLTRQDCASLVSFDDQVEVPVAQRRVTDKGMLAAAARALYARGSTNLSGGLFAGYREVRKHAAPGQVNRVLLLTDGLANVGLTDPAQLVEKARGMRESGLTLSTLGVGADFDEELLTALAEAGGGETYFIENPDRIPEIFQRELQGLLSVVAQNVVVAFRPAQGCRISAAWGYTFSGGPHGVVASVPDMYAGEERGILLELAVPPLKPGRHKLGEFVLNYEEALRGGGSVEAKSQLTAVATRDEGTLVREQDHPEVLRAQEIHRTARAMEEAVSYADQGRVDDALFCLKAQCDHLEQLPHAVADPEVERAYRDLKEQVERLQASGYNRVNRKQMVFASRGYRQVRRRSAKGAQ